jgi:hypothetical protein
MAGIQPQTAPSKLFALWLLHFCQNDFLDLLDSGLVALVEGPLLDSLGASQAGLAQNLHVFASGWLADTQLARDQAAANPILHQVAVDLRWKMLGRVLKPKKNL